MAQRAEEEEFRFGILNYQTEVHGNRGGGKVSHEVLYAVHVATGDLWFNVRHVGRAMEYSPTQLSNWERDIGMRSEYKTAHVQEIDGVPRGTFFNQRGTRFKFADAKGMRLIQRQCSRHAHETAHKFFSFLHKQFPKEPLLAPIEENDARALPSKESLSLSTIKRVFASHRHEPQFQVLGGAHRIDLYFLREKVAVECDENDHAERDPVAERKRQAAIAKELGCVFYRFDPDAKDFDVVHCLVEIGELLARHTDIPEE